ncbi:MAG: glycoside hydrolase family 38 C-terminal domain-containing protein [bacterium]
MTQTLHMIGNAHLDPAWMWRLDEGFEAFLATCRSALDRMAETEEFIFTASSAAHYEFVERVDPQLFKKIQQALRDGRWSIVGGWWVEADCNLPSGESFIRQGLYGQNYFLAKFGIKANTGFCVDSFGHNANLPQLLNHCALDNYVFMRPQEHEKYLEDALFKWQAPSGDEVIAYRIPLHYSNFQHTISDKIKLLSSDGQYAHEHPWMLFYGVGNHGGGPTREQIAQIISAKASADKFNPVFSSVDNYFREVRAKPAELNVLRDEMQPHAIGCYSANSAIKKLNRSAENRLLRAEKFAMLARSLVSDFSPDWLSLRNAWKNVLLNQFHDILGGVAIREASEDAICLYQEAHAVAARQEREAIEAISVTIDTHEHLESLILFNPHSWEVTEQFEFELWTPEASERGETIQTVNLIADSDEIVLTQRMESSGKIADDRVRFTARAELPPYGWKKFAIVRNGEVAKVAKSIVASSTQLSNGICGIVFEGEPLVNQIAYSSAQVFQDDNDTWGHGITGFTQKKGIFKVDEIIVVERAPVRGRVRVSSSYGSSKLVEDFILYAGADFIEQRVFLDWRKTNAVVKLRHPHNMSNPKITYEIPNAVIERPVSSDEVPGGAWVFLQDATKSLGLVNDAKYSYSADEKYFYTTIARSPLYAHHSPPHKVTKFETKRYLDQGEQEFIVNIFPGMKSWTEVNMPQRALELLQPTIVHVESSHSGKLSRSLNMFAVTEPNILITSVKAPHNTSEKSGVIVRAVESLGKACACEFTSEILNLSWKSSFRPFQLRSFFIQGSNVIEINGLEETVESK